MISKCKSLVILAAALLLPETAGAGQIVAVDAVLKVYCSDKDGSAHPKQSTLTHFITHSDFGAVDQALAALSYDSSQCCSGGAGIVRASLEREDTDNDRQNLGDLKIRTDPQSGTGGGVIDLDGDLSSGTAFVWDLRFTKFRNLPKDACIALTSAIAR